MENKSTVLITGGTDGIGKAAAIEIAGTGANIIVVGRNQQKATKALQDIKLQSSNPKVEAITADLSSLTEIDRLVAAVTLKYPALDVLVNNIGYISTASETTVDGYEKIFFLNHLLPFYLTHKLLPLLQANKGSRIVNVTGAAYSFGKIDFDNLQAEKRPKPTLQKFAQAKLALVQCSLLLAKALQNTGCGVFVSDPGVAKSGMGPQNEAWPWLFRHIIMPLTAASTQVAAKSTVYAAVSRELNGKTGLFINAKSKIIQPARPALDGDISSRLWQTSETLLNIK